MVLYPNGLAADASHSHRIIFGDGGSVFNAGAKHDVLIGGGGRNVLSGGNGKDWLVGGKGNDKLNGGSGDDVLSGGTGNDILVGDKGFEDFMFYAKSGRDIIHSFNAKSGKEDIDFSSFSAIKNFKDLSKNCMSETGDHIEIKTPSLLLTLKNVELSDLDASDFIF